MSLTPSPRPQSPTRGAHRRVVGPRPAGWPDDPPDQHPDPARPHRDPSRDSRSLAGLLTAASGAARLDRLRRPGPGSTGRRGEAGGPVDIGLILKLAVAGDAGFGREPVELESAAYPVGLPPSSGTGWTSAINVISNEARLAAGSPGSVTVAFHCRVPVTSSSFWRTGRPEAFSSRVWYSLSGATSPIRTKPCGNALSNMTLNRYPLGIAMNCCLSGSTVCVVAAGGLRATPQVSARSGPFSTS